MTRKESVKKIEKKVKKKKKVFKSTRKTHLEQELGKIQYNIIQYNNFIALNIHNMFRAK